MLNTHYQALDEIYKIYMLLHRSDLKISKKTRQKFATFSDFLRFFTSVEQILQNFCLICIKISRIIASFQISRTELKIPEYIMI